MNQQALLHTSYDVLKSKLHEAGERFIVQKEVHLSEPLRGSLGQISWENIVGIEVYCNPIVADDKIKKIEQILDKYHNEISITKDSNGVLITLK